MLSLSIALCVLSMLNIYSRLQCVNSEYTSTMDDDVMKVSNGHNIVYAVIGDDSHIIESVNRTIETFKIRYMSSIVCVDILDANFSAYQITNQIKQLSYFDKVLIVFYNVEQVDVATMPRINYIHNVADSISDVSSTIILLAFNYQDISIGSNSSYWKEFLSNRWNSVVNDQVLVNVDALVGRISRSIVQNKSHVTTDNSITFMDFCNNINARNSAPFISDEHLFYLFIITGSVLVLCIVYTMQSLLYEVPVRSIPAVATTAKAAIVIERRDTIARDTAIVSKDDNDIDNNVNNVTVTRFKSNKRFNVSKYKKFL